MSYYVDRSQSHILVHVALPALLTGALWLGLLLRSRPRGRPRRAAAPGSRWARRRRPGDGGRLVVGAGAVPAHAAGPRRPRRELPARVARPPVASAAARSLGARRRAGARPPHAGRAREPRPRLPRPGAGDPAAQRPRGPAVPRRPVGGEPRRRGRAAGLRARVDALRPGDRMLVDRRRSGSSRRCGPIPGATRSTIRCPRSRRSSSGRCSGSMRATSCARSRRPRTGSRCWSSAAAAELARAQDAAAVQDQPDARPQRLQPVDDAGRSRPTTRPRSSGSAPAPR